ncbi:MAG TPA: hypothetical protein VFQ24_05065 [Terriglobia bacterium]|nr:hypothetical protein [Terriglobia bacterium]
MELLLKDFTIPKERGGRISFSLTMKDGEAEATIHGLLYNRTRHIIEYQKHRSKNFYGQTAQLSPKLHSLVQDLVQRAERRYGDQVIPSIIITNDMLRKRVSPPVGEAVDAESLLM